MYDTRDPDTDEQILLKLNRAWEDATGIDTDEFQLRRDTTRAQMMQAYEGDSLFSWFSDSLDLMDLCYRLERDFVLDVTQDEWIELFGGADHKTLAQWQAFQSQWTVQDLIQFLRERICDISFDPVNICGKDCAPAGAFFGMRELIQYHRNTELRFGPSSRIDDVLGRDAFLPFWRRLRLLTRNRAPRLVPRISSTREVLRTITLWIVYSGILYLVGGGLGLAGFVWLWLIVPASFAAWIHSIILSNPDLGTLPDDIQTFRDLAEYIAKQPAVT